MKSTETAVFAGGCFWCTEAVFKMLRGVFSVMPGYTGGHTEEPTYDQVSTGKTGHAEAIQIVFDPNEISYRALLSVFFGSHDPTSLNRQGNDVGEQYRSAVFFATPVQKAEAEKYIKEINASHKRGSKVVTAVEPLSVFYPAEEYHRDYFANHQSAPYCELIINPKLEHVRKEFAHVLKVNAKTS